MKLAGKTTTTWAVALKPRKRNAGENFILIRVAMIVVDFNNSENNVRSLLADELKAILMRRAAVHIARLE